MIVRDAQVDTRRVVLPIPTKTSPAARAEPTVDAEFEARVAAEVERRLADAMAELKRHTAEHAQAITAQGYRDGFAEGRTELEKDAEQLSTIAQSLLESRTAMLQRLERHCAALAFGVACKVVGEGILSGTMIEAWVRQGLTEFKQAGSVRVRMNPEDLRLMDTVAPGIREGANWSPDVALWIADESFSRGEGAIESDEQAVEISIKTQLERLANALIEGGKFEE